MDVHDEQVESLLLDTIHGLQTVHRAFDAIALRTQDVRDQVAHVLVVVRDQYLGFCFSKQFFQHMVKGVEHGRACGGGRQYEEKMVGSLGRS
ncbi:MAG: hypothetical protein A2V88_07795 [Elusimicrobia bacterium RBG_16_66_12]|nr:MAG: hypothetical protein A2V88_07795 [Elusimicrobia bacterium RBG_16_66_12]